MAKTMGHRGCGKQSFFTDEHASLCSLPSENEEQDGGAEQLIANETGRYRLICDGTIYNHRQL